MPFPPHLASTVIFPVAISSTGPCYAVGSVGQADASFGFWSVWSVSPHNRFLVLVVSIIACHAGDRGSIPLRLGIAPPTWEISSGKDHLISPPFANQHGWTPTGRVRSADLRKRESVLTWCRLRSFSTIRLGKPPVSTSCGFYVAGPNSPQYIYRDFLRAWLCSWSRIPLWP